MIWYDGELNGDSDFSIKHDPSPSFEGCMRIQSQAAGQFQSYDMVIWLWTLISPSNLERRSRWRKNIISINCLIWIHPLDLKTSYRGVLQGNFGGNQRNWIPLYKSGFWPCRNSTKKENGQKTACLRPKMYKLLMSVKVYHFIVTNWCWYAQTSSSTMFCSGSRHARPLGAASTSADGRFTPMVSNLLKRGILVPYMRHWKHCTLLFKFQGP